MAMKQHTRQLHFGKLLRRHGTNVRRRGWAYMPRPLQQEPDGVAVALAIHLSLYCAIAACFALVIYFLMQPTRLPNPGMAAHKPSPTTLNYVEALRSEREAAKRNVRLEPEPETTGAATILKIGLSHRPAVRRSRGRPDAAPTREHGIAGSVAQAAPNLLP
jgi:hypothetical protein